MDITLEYLMEPEHLFDVMHDCGNGVRWKASTQKFEVDKLRWAATLREEVLNDRYKSRGFKQFDICERGKRRHIQAVHISERVVQKLICRYALIPTIYPALIYDNSASQQGKGTEFALKRLKEHLRWHYARYGKRGAVLVMDYRDFFNSIPHEAVIQTLTAKIEDDRIRRYVSEFINAFDGDVGLGLGSETCQIGAICFPGIVDKLAKERLRIHCYGRYMDDSYIIHPDRAYAERCLEEIQMAARSIGIAISEKKTKIHNLKTDDFEFLKKRVRLTESGKVLLRISRDNFTAEKRRIAMQRAEYEAGRMPTNAIAQSYRAWRGYAGRYDNYGSIGEMDRYFQKSMNRTNT